MATKKSKKQNGVTSEEGSAQLTMKKDSEGQDDNVPLEEQQTKIENLRSALGSLSSTSQRYCTEPCLKRYLRARNWHVKKAEKMLKESLKWRKTFKPETIRWDDIATEGETGKVYKANFFDKFGRTILIMRPARQNTKDQRNQIRQLVYCLENAILNMPQGQEQMVWLIDFDGWTMSNSVPLSQARETANILQNHYPERLALAILYNPPRIFETFWALVKPFLDPKTHKKVRFVYTKSRESMNVLEEVFDMEKLDASFGGEAESEYNHEEYGKLMQQEDLNMAAYWKVESDVTTTTTA